MTIDSNQITLETVSIRLDSKKITNAILDQIPRIDFCELLLDADADFNYTGHDNIEVMCRFSLVSLLNSDRRIYKSKGYNTDHINRIMEGFNYQDEALLFTVDGQLYCDSFSSKTGTKRYGEYHKKLKGKTNGAEKHLEHVSQLLDLHKQGIEPVEIAKNFNYSEFNYGSSGLPHGLPRRIRKRKSPPNSNESIFDDWEDDIDDWEDDLETKQSKELNRIIKQFGTWPNYIKELKIEFQEYESEKNKYEKCISDYENATRELVGEILSKPFALLGC